MDVIIEKAKYNLKIAYLILSSELQKMIKYTDELAKLRTKEDISLTTCIVMNKFLSVNTILYTTFSKELYELYRDERLKQHFNKGLFVFILYLRNYIVHEGFYKIRVFPEDKVEIEKGTEKYKIFKINIAISDIEEFLKIEEIRKPNKRELILAVREFIESYHNSIDITKVLVEYYNGIVELYRVFEYKLGLPLDYLD